MAVHRLFVIEDDEGTRNAMREIFSRMGWEVSTAATVREGLALIDSQPEPCCLVLDLDLPDGRGEEVLAHVRAKNLKTHVAVASGNMESRRLRAVANLRPDVLLTKPVTAEDIWDGICRVCEDRPPS